MRNSNINGNIYGEAMMVRSQHEQSKHIIVVELLPYKEDLSLKSIRTIKR
jgi:hypothetical protein